MGKRNECIHRGSKIGYAGHIHDYRIYLPFGAGIFARDVMFFGSDKREGRGNRNV
jgi:hypothetical protein